jgi:hypothetical protein
MYQFKMPSNLVQRGQPVPQFPGMRPMSPASAAPAMRAAPSPQQAPSLNQMVSYYNPQAMAPQAPTAAIAPQAPRIPSLDRMGPMGMGMGMPAYGSMPQSSGPSFFTL